MAIQKITPFIWFDSQAQAAANFYVSLFKDSSIVSSNPMVTVFELEGLRIMALNGGPVFKLNEAFSLVISCDTQEEIDYYWDAFGKEGKESRCGWIQDKFGLWWQVVPTILGALMNDPAKAPKVTDCFMKMNKFNIQELLAAAQ
jgi:predicted 3-demethylubiquinone-9 3-methyltransferase (glyoxalase superfamily)